MVNALKFQVPSALKSVAGEGKIPALTSQAAASPVGLNSCKPFRVLEALTTTSVVVPQISLGLAQAYVTALVTANNYSVTVDHQGSTNTVNATQVANNFIAGLQDALTPCARNVSSSSNTTSGSNEYFAAIASVNSPTTLQVVC